MKKFLSLVLVLMLILTACGGGQKKPESNSDTPASEEISEQSKEPVAEAPEENRELTTGDTWKVDGQWELTVNSVKATDYRNEYVDFKPAQVIEVNYTYKNIGYENDSGILDGLYMDPSKAVDSEGEMAKIYTTDLDNMPQEVPVDAKITAVYGFGLHNESDKVKIYFNNYDGNGNKQDAVFNCPVEQ